MVEIQSSRVNDKTHAGLTKAASYASLSVALTLVAAKVWAFSATGSISILSALVDSVLDVLASAITFVAIRYSLQPADAEHRFGHGKSEGLAALAQSVIIAGSAIFVWSEAVQRLISPQAIEAPLVGVIVVIGSTIMTLALLGFQRMVVKRTGSIAIAADALHYKMDVLVNLSVAVAILLAAWTRWQFVDPLVGIGIAAYIMWSTYRIAARSLDILLDREIPVDDRKRIREIAIGHDKVKGFHDLRTRTTGTHYFLQFHLELDPHTSLLNTHVILDEVEDSIRAEFPRCEIIVHADPVGLPEARDHFE
ncbi:MAG: cation diffusion facilitator family transporter [Gammaproteobacteria bacterium]